MEKKLSSKDYFDPESLFSVLFTEFSGEEDRQELLQLIEKATSEDEFDLMRFDELIADTKFDDKYDEWFDKNLESERQALKEQDPELFEYEDVSPFVDQIVRLVTSPETDVQERMNFERWLTNQGLNLVQLQVAKAMLPKGTDINVAMTLIENWFVEKRSH